MNKKLIKRNLVLGILFFLPVVFLLFMYPAKHNYIALDILEEEVLDIQSFDSKDIDLVQLEDHITILGFLGHQPKDKLIAMSNLKELMYDKFKGFKKFQIVMIVPDGVDIDDVSQLKSELSKHEQLKYWHYVYGTGSQIKMLYESLNMNVELDVILGSNHVVIIDKELNLRGRLDDRTDSEKEQNNSMYQKKSYNCIEVAEIKNKMSEDLRILFTEYRQKRKGNFDSTTRRASDLKKSHEQN